jgi:hypothetical protein
MSTNQRKLLHLYREMHSILQTPERERKGGKNIAGRSRGREERVKSTLKFWKRDIAELLLSGWKVKFFSWCLNALLRAFLFPTLYSQSLLLSLITGIDVRSHRFLQIKPISFAWTDLKLERSEKEDSHQAEAG